MPTTRRHSFAASSSSSSVGSGMASAGSFGSRSLIGRCPGLPLRLLSEVGVLLRPPPCMLFPSPFSDEICQYGEPEDRDHERPKDLPAGFWGIPNACGENSSPCGLLVRPLKFLTPFPHCIVATRRSAVGHTACPPRPPPRCGYGARTGRGA